MYIFTFLTFDLDLNVFKFKLKENSESFTLNDFVDI